MLKKDSISFPNSPLGKMLEPQELEMLFAHSQKMQFNRGDIILKQGDKCLGMYIIIEGTVIARAKILGNGITNIDTLQAGDFLGEVSYLEKVPCAMSMIANTQTQCLLISPLYFEVLAAYFPETKYKLLYAITQQIAARLKRVHDKVIEFMTNTEMTTAPSFLLGKIIESLTKPQELSWEDNTINMHQLLELSFFKHFSLEEKQELIQHSTLIQAPKNCKLIHAGEKEKTCYIVLQGAVQSSVVQQNKIAKLSVIGPITLFASISCIDIDSDFTITFTTCENALLLKISEENLNYLKQNYNNLWYKLFSLICHSVVALEKSVDKLEIRLHIETYNR